MIILKRDLIRLVRAGILVTAALTVMWLTPIPTREAVAEEGPLVVMPLPDAEHGRELFIVKGCVVCHSVNGVGGRAAPALDATAAQGPVDPLDFAARMWRGALAMADLQAMEFGYQIELTGAEIADLAAFAADADEQAELEETDIPEMMRGWTLDE